jgi:hypothetical protein
LFLGGHTDGPEVDERTSAPANAPALRKGAIQKEVRECSGQLGGIGGCAGINALVSMQYDCIGVGATIKAEINRLRDEHVVPRGVTFAPWNAAQEPRNKDRRVIPGDSKSPLIGDLYQNLKAQGWWELRERFERTYRALNEHRRRCRYCASLRKNFAAMASTCACN